MIYYVLKDGKPVPTESVLEWAEAFERTEDRIVQKDRVGSTTVSTVFLGLDHNLAGGAPLLWETMIFGGEHDQYQDRYSSLKDAKKGHAKAVKLISK